MVGALLLASISPAAADNGIDVSNWQHPYGAAINWQQVKDSGRSFVFIKATGGPTGGAGNTTNAYFASDWAAAGSVGLLRGAYQAAQPALPVSDSALLQARYFVSVTGSMQGAHDLPPVLDIEHSNGLNPAQLVEWLHDWLNEVEHLSGRRPIIYTGLSFWNSATGGSSDFAGYRLWFARYVSGTSPGQLPTGFPTWTFWQQSNTGTVPGISSAVDLDVSCCGTDNLNALAGSSGTNGGSPFGNVDVAAGGPDNTIRVAGWSIDPDIVGPIDTHIYIDGVGTNIGPTTSDRTDVAALFGQFGSTHGFSWSSNGYTPGPHSVCVFAINQSYGANTLLRCSTVSVPSGSPFGRVELSGEGPGGTLAVAGWTIDPDTASPTAVHVYVDGVGTNLGNTTGDRPDVAAVFPGYGATHGFNWVASGLSPGPHSVCVFGINLGAGSNTLLDCRTVTPPTGSPVGIVDSITTGPDGALHLSGWSLDPDVAAPLQTHVYVDGVGTNLGTTTVLRPDTLNGFAPGYSAVRGFDWSTSGLSPGAHSVCVFAINQGVGSNTLLRCQVVSVPGGNPFGAVDAITAAASHAVSVAGWVIDPDTASATAVHVYVDGVGTNLGPASGSRPDVAAAVPGYGANHGFTWTSGPLAAGSHYVCVFGINIGAGSNTTMACRTLVT